MPAAGEIPSLAFFVDLRAFWTPTPRISSAEFGSAFDP